MTDRPRVGDEPSGEAFRRAADERLRGAYDPPMSLESYVDRVIQNPLAAASGARYIVAAIESQGTRTVTERGETRSRYRFFDDPANDGEHAVIGNTAALNAFVDDLRAAASGRGNDETIVWIDGPTATGKSEFKRCLVNGLRAFSQTEQGRRYTIEWNVTGVKSADRSLSYGDGGDAAAWYQSPVQTQPLAVFPRAVRESIAEAAGGAGSGAVGEAGSGAVGEAGSGAVGEAAGESASKAAGGEAANDKTPKETSIPVDVDLDPFSREAYDQLESAYREEGRRDRFSALTDRDHLRVQSYVVDVGQGIGVLHAEDDGSPKERLVGSWMGGMLRELDSRGRKNPQAFSYDGVLSQGNGVATVVEDASQHADLLRRLLNVPDERRVKLDTGIAMDLDTQLIIISNPDLDAELDQYAEREGADPLKALKRRLTRHEFRYLTNRELEATLVRREVAGQTTVPGADVDTAVGGGGATAGNATAGDATAGNATAGNMNDSVNAARAPLTITVREDDSTATHRELAPHAVGAAALYAVVTRLDTENLPNDIDVVEKARLYETGEVRRDDTRLTVADLEESDRDGRSGIPVTYTRDTIAAVLSEESDRTHPSLPVEEVVMPMDIVSAMKDGLTEAPVFSSAEAAEFESRVEPVRREIRRTQRADVVDAALAADRVSTETVTAYVEHVYAWDADEPIETDRGRTTPDALAMKVFETETLGRFEERDYNGTEPKRDVVTFRREKVIQALTRYAWRNRGDAFSVEDVDLTAIPELEAVLEANDLADLKRRFPEMDPAAWADPPADTETESVKTATIDRLVERGYSRASAELTSRAVMREARAEWADLAADGGESTGDSGVSAGGDDRGANGGGPSWD